MHSGTRSVGIAILMVLLCLSEPHHAFSPVPIIVTKPSPPFVVGVLSAAAGSSGKKRRRSSRRKDEAVPPAGPSSDLPDFELRENDEPEEERSRTQEGSPNNEIKQRRAAMQQQSLSSSPPVVRAEGPMLSVKSVRELLADRSLERKLEFDVAPSELEGGGEALPDLVELMRRNSRGGGLGGGRDDSTASSSTSSAEEDSASLSSPGYSKKKARQEARRSAALAREQEEEEDFGNILAANVPFLVDKETGKVTGVKVLEAGTWLGIATLISWELYINSPFFDRAGPMAPIVY